nr:MAG TPA: hypothetical protein [Caudoviricetes sp.]
MGLFLEGYVIPYYISIYIYIYYFCVLNLIDVLTTIRGESEILS